MVAAAAPGCHRSREFFVAAGPGAAERLQEVILSAPAMSVVRLGEGRFEFARSLTIGVERLLLKGAGADRSVLSFRSQVHGSEGVLVTADGFVGEDFAVEDTRGDG